MLDIERLSKAHGMHAVGLGRRNRSRNPSDIVTLYPEMPDEEHPRLDITDIPTKSLGAGGSASVNASSNAPYGATARPYLSVMFNCCKVYQRVYANADGKSYQGRCPKCMRTIRFIVGAGGTTERSFVVE